MPPQLPLTAGLLLFLAIPQASAQIFRCELQDQPVEWIQVSADGGWRDWGVDDWEPDYCGQQRESLHLVEHWQCHRGRQRHVLIYTATDRHNGGVYQHTETLNLADGRFRRRINEGTHVPDGGKRLRLEFNGHCVAMERGP